MEALTLSDDIFDAAPAAPPPAWLAAASSSAPPASSAAAVRHRSAFWLLFDLPDDVLSDHVLTQLHAADLARVEAASARLRDLVARAAPIAVRDACKLLLPMQRRSGERWPAAARASSSSPPRATWARASRPDTDTPFISDRMHPWVHR